jgi:uncharacterized protein YdeI (BOF family)
MKPKREILALLGLSVLIGVAACNGLTTTPVNDLLQNPRKYEGKSIVISGNVTERNSLLVTKYFVLKDESGEIHVFTDRALPQVGAKVRVHGHVNQPLAFGNEDIVVFQEDSIDQPK